MSWKECVLSNLIDLKYGKSLPERDREAGEVPVYGSSGVTGYHNKPLIEGPGIIVGRKGTIGSVHYENRDFFPIDTVYYVEEDESKIGLKFTYYLLKTLPLNKLNTDAAVPGLNRNNALRVKCKVPSLKKQDKIVSILSTYDDLIENNRRRIQLLEESARLLYREWFVSFRFPGHEHVEIVDGLPRGWEKVKVGDLGEVITGKTPSTKISENFNGDIPFIKTPDMHKASIVIESEETLSERGAKTQVNKFIPENSIMVACIGAKLGVVALNGKLAQTNQQINAVIPNEEFKRYYIYFALIDLKPRLEAMGGGATMPNVNKSKFESMPVILPTKKLLTIFNDFCKPIFFQIKTLSLQNQKLKEARDILLPRLMNGEIAV